MRPREQPDVFMPDETRPCDKEEVEPKQAESPSDPPRPGPDPNNDPLIWFAESSSIREPQAITGRGLRPQKMAIRPLAGDTSGRRPIRGSEFLACPVEPYRTRLFHGHVLDFTRETLQVPTVSTEGRADRDETPVGADAAQDLEKPGQHGT